MRGFRFPLLALLAGAALPLALTGCSSTSGDGSPISRGLGSLANLRPSRDVPNAGAIDAGTTAVANTAEASYMDTQEVDLRAQLEPRGVKVERAGDQIVLTIPSATAFDANKDELRRSSQPLVASVATVLKRYERSTVEVYGHTDSAGDEKTNLELTQRRALALARYLARQGVDAKRLSVTGFGGSRPVGSNDTADGRLLNRRIEIQISPLTKT